jgi:predicted DNA-binding transcriptional regulator YafY
VVPEREGEKDVMVMRDLHLLMRLFQGRTLHLRGLADEFGVTVRTIQRDVTGRLKSLLGDRLCRCEKSGGYYLTWAEDEQSEAIAAAVLKSLSERMGERFHRYAQPLFRRQDGPFWMISHMEDLACKEREVRAIRSAIERAEGIAFDFVDRQGARARKTVFPLLILNAQGIWYLLGWSGEKAKSYTLKNIDRIERAHAPPPPRDLKPVIEGAINIWFTTDTPPFEARFWVRRDLVYHFERLPLSKHQRLYEAHANGDRIYAITLTSIHELLPTLKQYTPLTLPLHPPELVEAFRSAVCETVEMLENMGEI